jgi:hypothetical protein
MMDEATLMSDNEIGKMFSVRKSDFVPAIEIQN